MGNTTQPDVLFRYIGWPLSAYKALVVAIWMVNHLTLVLRSHSA